MADLWDAVDWTQLRDRHGAKAGYMDGPKSQWPAEAWATLEGPFVIVTTAASIDGEAFDLEAGNAPALTVFDVVSQRTTRGLWSWAYFAEDVQGDVFSAARAKSVVLLDRSDWPKAGCYVWAADPSGNLAAGRWRLPVAPVAVQDAWDGTVDHSTLYVTLPVAAAPSGPAPVPVEVPSEISGKVLDMNVLLDHNGNLTVVGEAKDNGNLLVFTRTGVDSWGVVDVTDLIHVTDPKDPRTYQAV